MFWKSSAIHARPKKVSEQDSSNALALAKVAL